MKTYKDLDDNEKVLFNKIEKIFIQHPSISLDIWCRVLGVVLNKYKQKAKP